METISHGIHFNDGGGHCKLVPGKIKNQLHEVKIAGVLSTDNKVQCEIVNRQAECAAYTHCIPFQFQFSSNWSSIDNYILLLTMIVHAVSVVLLLRKQKRLKSL